MQKAGEKLASLYIPISNGTHKASSQLAFKNSVTVIVGEDDVVETMTSQHDIVQSKLVGGVVRVKVVKDPLEGLVWEGVVVVHVEDTDEATMRARL